MLTQATTVALHGISAIEVCVETHISAGALPSFSIVGLPDKAVSESKERIRSALFSLGLSMPAKRVVINLAPANLQKEGSHYDLPILISFLIGLEILPKELEKYIILGEIGLDGSIKSVPGVLAASFFAASKQKPLICPEACGSEAVWGGNIQILAPAHLKQLLNHFRQQQQLAKPEGKIDESFAENLGDFSEIKGHDNVKRALLIAAAGKHNLLMCGPPGSGKSMMAKRFMSLLPGLLPKEALEVSMIYGVSHSKSQGLKKYRPFRQPHHSASMIAMVGGGAKCVPGEISLAHAGVLFLDELPEFPRNALESLRQSMETREAVISRALGHVSYPADFQMIAAMNPCRCGYLSVPSKECHQAPFCGQNYRKNLSGPLIDRFDMFVSVSHRPLQNNSLQNNIYSSSAMMKNFVDKAHLIQHKRYCQKDRLFLNAQASFKNIEPHLSKEAYEILTSAYDKLGFSMRRYMRIFKVARTIADLDESPLIQRHHMTEAISYRLMF